MGVSGIYREFTLSDTQKGYFLYWLLGLFWVQELVTAIGLYVIAYSVTLWYFSPKDESGGKHAPAFPLCKGCSNGIFYHLGSLAFGAFLIALCRWIQFILSYLAQQ